MTVYVVLNQGRFHEVFLDKQDAVKMKESLYMAGYDGIMIITKQLGS